MDYINLRFGLYINLAPNEKELVEKKKGLRRTNKISKEVTKANVVTRV